MVQKGKISSYQVTALILTTILGTSLIFVPAITAQKAGRDGWLSVLIAGVAGIVTVLITTLLGRRFPDGTIIEYAGKIIGRWPGKLIGLSYVGFYTVTGAVIAREFTSLLNTMFLPRTPPTVITFFLVLMGAVAVGHGLEVITRSNEFVMPLFLGSVFLVIILVASNIQFGHLTPVLAKGVLPVVKGSLVPVGWLGESSLLLILLPYLNNPKEGTKAGIKAVFYVTMIQLVVFITTIGVIGPELTATNTYPFLALARYIQVASFLSRVEPLVMIAWVTGVTIKISVFYFAATAGAAQVLGLKDYRMLVIPFGLVFLLVSTLFWQNVVQLLKFLDVIWPIFLAAPFQVVLPLLLLILAVIRKKGGARSAK